MFAGVAEIGGALQGVADGVAKNVSVGVAGEAGFVLNFNAAENQLPAGDERVNIISETDAHGFVSVYWRRLRRLEAGVTKNLRDLQIARCRDFKVGFFALDPANRATEFFH